MNDVVRAVEPQTNADVWERKRVQVSLRIERAGLSLIVERGLDGVTVDQIADRAGISTRTFFRYFRNVRDLLTPVPIREVRRMCRSLNARPAEEDLLSAFHAWFSGMGRETHDVESDALELELLQLWSAIARAAPEVVRSESHAVNVLSDELEDVVRTRLALGPDDEEDVGALAAAFAAVIWYAFTRALVERSGPGLPARLDRAFAALARIDAGAPLRSG